MSITEPARRERLGELVASLTFAFLSMLSFRALGLVFRLGSPAAIERGEEMKRDVCTVFRTLKCTD